MKLRRKFPGGESAAAAVAREEFDFTSAANMVASLLQGSEAGTLVPVEKIMPYHITLLETPPALEIQYIGRLSSTELMASVKQAMVLAEKHQCIRILTDCSLLEGGHGVFDLFEGVMEIYDNFVGSPFREAIVQSTDPKAAELVHFWETACKNRGLNVQVFPTRQAALDWLHT